MAVTKRTHTCGYCRGAAAAQLPPKPVEPADVDPWLDELGPIRGTA